MANRDPAEGRVRFHGRGPLALRLRRHARKVPELIDQAGGSNVRVLGAPVDLIPAAAPRPGLRNRVLAEAVIL